MSNLIVNLIYGYSISVSYNNMSLFMGDVYVPINPHKIKRGKRKARKDISIYRENKTACHTTIGGIGCVGRLKKGK